MNAGMTAHGEARVTVIQGDRVRLVPREPEMAALMQRWINDPSTRHLLAAPGYQVSLAAEEAFLRSGAEIGWDTGLTLAIEAIDREPAVLIGTIDLRALSPEHRRGDVGIMIGEAEYRGHGYGTEALRLLCRFAFDELDLHRIELGVLDFNERAIRSYRRVGFVEEGRRREWAFIMGRYYDDVLMGLLRDDFERAEQQHRT